MPYIKLYNRELLRQGQSPRNAGELNYIFTLIIKEYLEVQGESYQAYNDIIGALEGAKLELYRRRIAPYENAKRDINGDVY